MKTVISRAVKIRVLISLVLTITCGWSHNAHAQTNSWTNSISGNWEDAHWSLGALPGTNQTILFTNAGLNVLAIGPNTAQNFPQTMSVDSVTVSAPVDSANILLLNGSGFQTPLTANNFTVGSNAMALLYSSSLRANNGSSTYVIGTMIQDASSVVSNYFLEVSGIYQLNSGLLSSGVEDVYGPSGRFIQSGGSNLMAGIQIHSNAEVDVVAGQLDGDVRIFAGGFLNQTGGRVLAHRNFHIDGSFLLTDGIFEGPLGQPTQVPTVLSGNIGVNGYISQHGGTNTQFALILGFPWLGPDGPDTGGGGCPAITVNSGSYYLSDGLLYTGGVSIGPRGSFTQLGGANTINGDLTIHGMLIIFYEHHTDNSRVDCEINAGYALGGGVLSAQNLRLGGGGLFFQSGGTNEIANSMTLTNGLDPRARDVSYGINGGLLEVANIVSHAGTIAQFGGKISVGDFQLIGGQGFLQTGGVIVQSGLLSLQGTWQSGPGNQQLGRLKSDGALLRLPNAACVLHFQDSSSLAWSGNPNLQITNWSGSLYGGGQHQILFGANASSLTTQQLTQIQFQNPAGLPPCKYPARILATGEIVPDTGAPLLPMANLVCATNGLIHLSIGGDIGRTYTIEVSTDLVHWNTWTDQFNTCGTMTLDDNDSTNCPQRFYRAHAMP